MAPQVVEIAQNGLGMGPAALAVADMEKVAQKRTQATEIIESRKFVRGRVGVSPA
jgi:hypothetical protein